MCPMFRIQAKTCLLFVLCCLVLDLKINHFLKCGIFVLCVTDCSTAMGRNNFITKCYLVCWYYTKNKTDSGGQC